MITGHYLTPEQRQTLTEIVRKPTLSHGIARRANALLLLDLGMGCDEVGRVLFVSGDTVRGWHRDYTTVGLAKLLGFDWKGSEGYLTGGQKKELAAHLAEHWYGSSKGIIAHISETYGQKYTPSGCTKLLESLDFEYVKPQGIPAQANEKARQAFIDLYNSILNALMKNEAFYFSDAVHPEYQSRPAYGWFPKGQKVAVRRTSGRKRVNIQAAINLENFDCPFVEVDTVDAQSTIALFEKIEARNPDLSRIFVALDNAAYHHAKELKEWMARTKSRIKLVFLPAYAPNLNPIERLWGVMHRLLTHNKHYKTFNDFADAILTFFRETIPREWEDFRSEVTDNFRIISETDIRVLESAQC